MTKLKMLNSYLTERLMAAVSEILEVVQGTVQEFEEETVRTRRENELLKRRLQEVQLEAAAEWTSGSSVRLSARVVSLTDHQSGARHGQTASLAPRDHGQNQEQTLPHQQVAAEWKCQRQRTPSPSKNMAPDDAPPAGTTMPSPCVKEDLDRSPQDLYLVPDTSPGRAAFASPYVKRDVEQSPQYTAAPSCLNRDSDPRGPQDPYAPVEAAAMSACVKRDGEQDDHHDHQCVVDLLCGRGGIKTEPEELSLDVRSTEGAEMDMDRELLPAYLSDMAAGLESVAAESRYNPSHFLSDSGPLSAEDNSAEEGFLSHIGIDGVESALQLDFTSASVDPRVKAAAAAAGRKGQRPHLCPQCGKSFRHESRLKIHLRIHTGEKPFACALCGKRFNNDGTLRNHWRVHTELRLYSCPVCGKSFKDTYTCRKHQRVHNGRRAHVYRAQENLR